MIAALPRELAGLTRGWEARTLPGTVFVWTNGTAVAACAGMGAARVSLAVAAALESGRVTSLISAGFAGACNPSLRVGEVVRAGVVVDIRTGERFFDSQFKQVLVSSNAIASVREKARLWASYAADAVDMEAAEVARIAQGHGLRFSAIKVISDMADFDLEPLARFSTADGQFRQTAFALHSVMRPKLWSRLIALGRNNQRSLANLTGALQQELDS